MKNKKITILIILIGLALIMVGRASACTVDMYGVESCPPGPAATLGNVPYTPAVYTPVLPQIYDQGSTFIDNSPTYTPPATNPPVVITTPPTGTPPAPTPVYTPQPAYIPASPIIFNGNGTYTAQNTGVTTGTATSTSSGTGTKTEETSGGLLTGIFGGGKTSLFSNNTNKTEIDANMKALVNSKGLAMGTNGGSCQNGVQYLVMYKNITGQPLSNVAVRISIPNGLTPTNASGGSYSERDNTVTLFIGSLSKNQEGQILIDTKVTGTISGVARTEMVYTLPNQNQNMIVSYAFGDAVCQSGSALGASAIGSGNLFGGTLLGWLFLALFVSAFIYLIRFFLKRNAQAHGHGHAPAHAH